MKELRSRLIHLSRCRGMSRRTLRRAIHFDSTLDCFYKQPSTSINQQLFPKKKSYQLFQMDFKNKELINEIKRDSDCYQIMTIVDDGYPSLLKQVKDPPLVLYLHGNASLLNNQPSLSVVGSRTPTDHAREKMAYILSPLIKSNFTIVSGMARGIDSFAHELSLALDGHTIAVLGSGFNHIYPRENRSLFNHLSSKGLLISEYPPNTPPRKYQFPERNRIISGLSFGTLVIEAKERSGTMITVDQALDQGRDVFAVPGCPLLKETHGCNKIIQDGGKLVFKADDIAEEWNYLNEISNHFA